MEQRMEAGSLGLWNGQENSSCCLGSRGQGNEARKWWLLFGVRV